MKMLNEKVFSKYSTGVATSKTLFCPFSGHLVFVKDEPELWQESDKGKEAGKQTDNIATQ